MTQSAEPFSLLSTSISQDELVSQTSSIAIEENERFSKHHPLINLLIMSVGPILTTIGMSILDSVDLMIISHRFKNDPNSYAVQIIGIGFFVQQICMDIGLFLQQSIMVRVSSLIGEGKRDNACQLTVDIFRISILFSVIATILITFVAIPLMNFAGCTPNLIDQCMLLVISTIAGVPFATLFHIGTGFLQAIGKPFLNGALHLIANCLQTFIITPFLQFVIKIDVTLSNISQPISQGIIGLILFILIFRHKFTLKPTLNLFFTPFTKETLKALVMSLPMIPVFVYDLFPASLILRFMTSSSTSEEFKTDVIGVYTVIQKIFLIGYAPPLALSFGFLTAATYSISQHNYRKMFSLLFYGLLIMSLFYIVFIPIVVFMPTQIMKVFGISSESQLKIAKKMVPIPMYSYPIGMVCTFLVNFFVAVDRTLFSNLVSLFQLASLCVGSKIIDVAFPDDPMKQMYSYTISDLSTTVLTAILFVITLIPLLKKAKQTDVN